MSTPDVETQERYVPNLNEEYTGQLIENCALDLNTDLTITQLIDQSQNVEHDFLFTDDASDRGDKTDYPFDSQLATSLLITIYR